jgi:hypothetical protein
MMGSTDDPENGTAVAATVFSAVLVYAVGLNILLVLVYWMRC